ncbi:MAG: phosphoribosylglycinamide formyltransferase [Woeseiaceae bacterium]|nr:phosphoribosylglycinamide formyltransferase [Woeseiaceae bacterium]
MSDPTRPCRAAILISGGGTNLQAFIDAVAAKTLELDIVLVLSNKADAFGLERAKKAGIPTACIDHTAFDDRESFDRAMAREIDDANVDLIVLAGFMRILSPWFVQHYDGKVLNIHPALLPKYPGLDTHRRVLEAGDAEHGSTVHFVTEELDGGPRILAGRLKVRDGESPDDLMHRVQALEHVIYPRAAQLFATGRIRFEDGRTLLDGNRLIEPLIDEF